MNKKILDVNLILYPSIINNDIFIMALLHYNKFVLKLQILKIKSSKVIFVRKYREING